MSVFLRINSNELRDIKNRINKIRKVNLEMRENNFTLRDRLNNKEKILQKSSFLVSSIHEDLARLTELMPKVEPLTSKIARFEENERLEEERKDKEKLLKTLKKKISGLK